MTGETPDQGAGRVINGRHRLLRTRDAGGTGRLWLAYEEELACEVSVKGIVLPDAPADAAETAQGRAARPGTRYACAGIPHAATVHDVVVH
ncbi:hypothetical protein [Streptomyces sp. 142MFCol3.1]|uniref:hypothetical protein n=1 Tax=Streptomyces sp. 142MFCol3.1 TaxID=1172179 RepID=UPI0004080505|nr:hypothetical protein [Streptomyces sp. 142MFCol3.1]